MTIRASSNYRSIECLFNSLFRLTKKEHRKSTLLSLCEGNPPVTGGFPTWRDSSMQMIPFDDVIIISIDDVCAFLDALLQTFATGLHQCCPLPDHQDQWWFIINEKHGHIYKLVLSGNALDINPISRTISQPTFSNAFWWMKRFVFWLEFHWSLFLMVQLTIFQHWFR